MREAKRGDKISLNSRIRLYFFQGEHGINLRVEDKESDIIPESAAEVELTAINRAIRSGQLVFGSAPEKIIDVPDNKHFGDILMKGRNKVNDFMDQYLKNKLIKTSEKIINIEKLVELEEAGKCLGKKTRVSVMSILNKALDSMAGISNVVEEDVEELEINLTT